jgi:exopolysaccharide biosynthesis protein
MRFFTFKSILLIILFILVCLSYSEQIMAKDGELKDWEPLKKGLLYKKILLTQPNSQATLHAFKIDPSVLKIKPIVHDKGQSVKILAQKAKAIVAINANFFDENGRPLGLVKKDRKVIQPKKDISWWAVLCFRYKKVSIIPSKNVKQGYCHQAIQAGPRLVINGHIPKLKDNFSHKTAVGINNKGELIVAVTKDRLSIQKLAETFKKSETQKGLGCLNALNLDGGSSSQLYANIEKFELDLPSFIQVPVALGVF